jgi:hypothetical protein
MMMAKKTEKRVVYKEHHGDPTKCIYCGKLPGVHHLKCGHCGDLACLNCICINEEEESKWICNHCTMLECGQEYEVEDVDEASADIEPDYDEVRAFFLSVLRPAATSSSSRAREKRAVEWFRVNRVPDENPWNVAIEFFAEEKRRQDDGENEDD